MISRDILIDCGGKVGFIMSEELCSVLLNELYMRRLQDVVNTMVKDLERIQVLLEQLEHDEQE
ncbi:hypothetical protein BCJMU07_p82 (plasmid) [Bacillus cereus]|nr:hypothetical protein BCJMU07_p82 [Bacillus cereus]